MAIEWSEPQRARVAVALTRHPRTSPRCVEAAREILPVALERDGGAHGLLVEPAMPFARFVLPRHRPRPEWCHHVLVHVELHAVDAMTGVDGHPFVSYLATFFDAPEAHSVTAVDLVREDL